MSKLIKIAHLTSAHARYDIRIFIKMCLSIVKFYDTSLVVADGLGNEVKGSVNIIDVGSNTAGRFSRMTKVVNRIFVKAVELDVEIYHLHDPELIPIGLKLKKLGKKVIFDSHEDVPKQMLSKPYLNMPLRRILGWVFYLYESYACRKFDAIIAATPHIRDKFLKINANTIDVNNFPLLSELINENDWKDKKNEIVYVGGVTKIRGVKEIVEAMTFTEGVRFNLVGSFSEQDIEQSIKLCKNWIKVNELGFLSRQAVKDTLAKSKIGLVTFLPAYNHFNAQPNKIFEYMSAGLPVIASNFSLWRKIVEGNQCGFCIDPFDSKAIGKAIQYLIDNPLEAERMGKNGRQAVENKYNWPIEENKLLNLYKRLI